MGLGFERKDAYHSHYAQRAKGAGQVGFAGSFQHGLRAGGYRYLLDYRRTFEPPLSEKEKAWVEEMLAKALQGTL